MNLSLRILRQRPDGYHDLDTVMQKLDLCDLVTLTVTDAPGIILRCPDSDLPEDRSNIVWRAAESFLAMWAGGGKGVAIVLEKRIPVAAGLGGGSSDAGVVLVGLNRLLEAGFSLTQLLEMGKSLGADVPFFVTGHGAVRAEGIGDRMTVVPSLADCTVVLVNPGLSVSTRSVYEKYALTRTVKDSKLHDSRKKRDGIEPEVGVNDLEQVTLVLYPEIAVLKQRLLDLGASSVLMSGSGPTVFGIFPHENGCVSASVRQAVCGFKQQSGVKVFVTQPV